MRLEFEPPYQKNKQNDCAPSEDSDQPEHPPSLIRVFAVRLEKARILRYPLSTQRRLWSDWADAQADLSLRWAHMPFCWFCHDAAQFCYCLVVSHNHTRPKSKINHDFILARLRTKYSASVYRFALLIKWYIRSFSPYGRLLILL